MSSVLLIPVWLTTDGPCQNSHGKEVDPHVNLTTTTTTTYTVNPVVPYSKSHMLRLGDTNIKQLPLQSVLLLYALERDCS